MSRVEVVLGGDAYTKFKYPAGELQVRLAETALARLSEAREVIVTARITSAEQIVELYLLFDAIEEVVAAGAVKTLVLPYLPYARADRRFVKGDCFGLNVLAGFLNNLKVAVVTLDAHSAKSNQLVNNLTDVSAMPLIAVAAKSFAARCQTEYITMLFPDEGARQRYSIPGNIGDIKTSVLHCSKKRDAVTGKFVGFTVPEAKSFPQDESGIVPVLIIDDICDGGGTFLGIAEAMSQYKLTLGLYVTHGIFSKGMSHLEEKFQAIYTTDSFREWTNSGLLEVIPSMPLLNEAK